jgi:glycosyltransferase involved in cell wall biosynthesis
VVLLLRLKPTKKISVLLHNPLKSGKFEPPDRLIEVFISHPSEQPRVIVIGTDVRRATGGVSVALSGYLRGLDGLQLLHGFIPTHNDRALQGRVLPFSLAFPKLVREIRAVRRTGYQPVVYAHGGGGLSVFRKVSLLRAARLAGATTLLQLHSVDVQEWVAARGSLLALKQALKPVQHLCVLSTHWKRLLMDAGISTPISVIPNPLTPCAEAAANADWQPKEQGETVHILHLTRLVSGKGTDLLLKAMVGLPEQFHCTIAGDGQSRSQLEALAKTLGVAERVQFIGWVSEEEKERVFMESDLFCLPTQHDSFGMGFIEAMSYGLPVVALNWGVVPDVVPHNQVGHLAQSRDPEALATSVLFFKEAARRAEFGLRARNWAREQFSAESVALKIRAAIEKVEHSS